MATPAQPAGSTGRSPAANARGTAASAAPDFGLRTGAAGSLPSKVEATEVSYRWESVDEFVTKINDTVPQLAVGRA